MSIDKICTSCCEEQPRHECPESARTCGHHCNCSWHQDHCCWCDKTFGPDSSPEQLDIYCLTPKQIIRELLVRLYILHPDPVLLRARGSLNDPLTWPRGMEEDIPADWLNIALGGEAKVLWDMYNESPYTPLETELLQRLQVVDYVHNKAEAGDFVDNWLAKAIYAPIEEITPEDTRGGFMLEHGLPWNRPWVWNSYKDQF